MGKANGTAADPGRGATQRGHFWVGADRGKMQAGSAPQG